MEFKKIRIADLIPASYNPRKKLKKGDREYEKIRNSITEFGYVEPVIVNSDMCETAAVQRAAFDRGFYELVLFIEENRESYWDFILTGKE